MKQPVSFEETVKKNKNRLVRALPYLAGSRKPRSKPRDADESVGLAIAAAEIVRKALETGKLKKSPKGFILK